MVEERKVCESELLRPVRTIGKPRGEEADCERCAAGSESAAASSGHNAVSPPATGAASGPMNGEGEPQQRRRRSKIVLRSPRRLLLRHWRSGAPGLRNHLL